VTHSVIVGSVKIFSESKGLSPVVAVIILIAVTVAVAIAATTWLGSEESY
jgi:flagellin-like protein